MERTTIFAEKMKTAPARFNCSAEKSIINVTRVHGACPSLGSIFAIALTAVGSSLVDRTGRALTSV